MSKLIRCMICRVFWKRKSVRNVMLVMCFLTFSYQMMTVAKLWSNGRLTTPLNHTRWERHITGQARTDRTDVDKIKTSLTENEIHPTTVRARGQGVETSGKSVLPDRSKDQQNLSQSVDMSTAYRHGWIGFPDMSNCSCEQMLTGPTNNSLYQQRVQRLSSQQILMEAKDCSRFKTKFGFTRYPPVSIEEREFPIAYIILFHRSLDQVLFLLRAIYRPHNVYCLTLDTTSGPDILKAARSLGTCLPNVFVASKLEDIVYAGFSRLMADVDCMEDLVRHPVRWKYVINMPGEQFPLRTNLELVRTFKLFNGSNNLEVLTADKALLKYRYLYKAVYLKNNVTGVINVRKGSKQHEPPPHGFDMAKGSTYGCFARELVEFLFTSTAARDLLEWSRDVVSPDEYFWAMLHYSKGVKVPGSLAESKSAYPYITSLSVWKGGVNGKCATKYVHAICIFSPEDVFNLVNCGNLFANKFYIDHHPAALHCLDEMLLKQTFSGTARDFPLP
ncbi:unnamed protein product [Lymnaea stagnalis]|uniref:Uncharacterized protein n=1 Tax=Lymnaea stagnalis TaxID=6523 RepID=A0AAV2IEG3_LYMST